MATRKKQAPKEPIHVSSLSLTPTVETILKRLSQDAGDYIGRSISSSSVVRALLLYADQQPVAWTRDILFPLIEEEMEKGTLWGKRKS
jgi:hypothetical protein